MASLEQVLSVSIPVGVILIFVVSLYVQFQEGVNEFFKAIGKFIGWAFGSLNEESETIKEKVLKYE